MVRNNPLRRIGTLSDLVHHMFRDDSHYTIITGKNKSGKTTLAFNLMEKAYLNTEGFKWFGSNVKGIRDCPFPSDYVTDLETLEEAVDYADGKSLFFFDEMGKSLGKRKFMARLNVEFLEKLQVIRKSKLSLIGCAIGDSVDREILKPYYLNSWIDKGSRYTKDKLTYYDIDLEATRTVSGLQRCQTKFKEYSVASFSLARKLNVKDLNSEFSQKLYRYRVEGLTRKEAGIHPEEYERYAEKRDLEYLREEAKSHDHILLSEATPQREAPPEPL